MLIEVRQGDITTERVDAIVNAANSSLLGGGGVDGAIHAAGGPEILAECRDIRKNTYPDGLPTGQAVASGSGRLNARWVIHTVGPVYTTREDRSALLRDCYRNSLAVAARIGATSIAFPLISSGIFAWPKEDAIEQALAGLADPPESVTTVRLVLFDRTTYALARDRVEK